MNHERMIRLLEEMHAAGTQRAGMTKWRVLVDGEWRVVDGKKDEAEAAAIKAIREIAKEE